jgi:1-acyl-sn-glycerol-3-phosphate acyltransferase
MSTVDVTANAPARTTPARRPVADRLMRALAGLLVHVFFRRIEVVGADRLPADRPLLVVGNHTNGLVDGLLLIALLDRYPRFLGKSTLFKVLPLNPFLHLAGMVPVYRAADGEAAGRNDATFARCHQMLHDGGAIAIFPEGISHDEASLQPLRTGAARIALGAAFDEHVADVAVVPVGLVYDAKATFRSRALVNVGTPLAVDAAPATYGADPHAAARSLTDEIDAALREVGPDYETVAQAEVLARIADVAALEPGRPRRSPAALSARDQMARALARADRDGRVSAAQLRDLLDAQERYERDLALLGVSDADVAAQPRPGRVRRSLAWSAVKILVTAPIALVGAVIHVVPYQIMKRVGRLPRNEGIRSTVKLLGCAVLFVVEWVVLAAIAAVSWGPVIGLAVLVGCPLSGYVAARFAERVRDAGGLARATRALRSRHTALDAVLADRADLVARARELAA